ncbi:type II secretion system protein [Pseudomonas sp.]|uniref:type II secretion system protein n=1 Tax=Pseudomonas sp. TaxID=306 RepID=UPI002630F1B4|nr:type II secretion system protein [Pseudomonas sp.]
MSNERGFTLLEMLAALAVLAVCSSVLLVAFGQSARSLQQVQRSDRVNLAARSLLDELGEAALQPGRSEGQWDGLGWQLDVRVLPPTDGVMRLYRLDVAVTDGRQETHYSTLRVRASGSGALP